MDVFGTRSKGPAARRMSVTAAVVLTLAVGSSATAATANGSAAPVRARAASGSTCSGTLGAPGVLAGVHHGNVSVDGYCDVDAGKATVEGSLTLHPDSSLIAAYASSDEPYGETSLTVTGNLRVQSGASALLGCEPGEFPCLDNSERYGAVRIAGSLKASDPLGVVVHNGIVDGSIRETGGGGGESCEETSGPFLYIIGYPVYSDYEDSIVGKKLMVRDLTSCWLGIARVKIGGSMDILSDHLGDPDAIEILSNRIGGDLKCEDDKQNVWDSWDFTGELWPREAEPNTVTGKRSGQCVLASPPTEGGAPGPGPF